MAEVAKTAVEQTKFVRTGRPFADSFAPMLPVGGLSGINPYAMVKEVAEELDRALADVRRGALEVRNWTPNIECKRANGNLIVNAELPGLKKDEVKVEITHEGLILEGERKGERAGPREGVYRSERSYGRFYRFVPLPEGAKAEEATAELNDGILTVTVPLPEVKEHRRAIPVMSGR